MEIAYVLIKTQHGKLKIVSSTLKEFKEVDEVHEIYGRYDLIMKVVAEDRTCLKAFIQNKLQITEGITNSEVMLANDVPIEEEDAEEDVDQEPYEDS